MTYQVSIGAGGYAGWSLIKRTEASQKIAIQREPQIQATRDHFIADFSKIEDVGDLLSDYQLLKVTLTAFGLDDDIKNKAFIKKVLESDISDKKSFVNRLSDRRYLKLAESLQLNQPEIKRSSTGEEIFELFIEQIFEIRIGDEDPLLRQALHARRELPELASKHTSAEAFWYTALASAPLRAVLDRAFGLPAAFGRLPIERQLGEYMQRAANMFGDSSPQTISLSNNIEKIIATYLLRSQLDTTATHTPYSIALSILTAP